jgi:Raf kinase inhibitor-like YbhB/YbcL family protein
MKPRPVLYLVAAMLLGAGDLQAQAYHPILVESPAMQTGQPMPRDYTPDGRNVSPPLAWRDLPPGTRQIAVVCEDHGAGNPPPWVHWIIYNIPATADGLPENLPIYPDAPMPAEITGAVQGKNGWGRAIYRGPAPPIGQLHNYNFFVYALDAELDLPAGLTRQELMERIEGHIIGRGAIVPFYRRAPVSARSE